MHVWDEFSEFLPENRVPTSADFNTYPIRIFCFVCVISKIENIPSLCMDHGETDPSNGNPSESFINPDQICC